MARGSLNVVQLCILVVISLNLLVMLYTHFGHHLSGGDGLAAEPHHHRHETVRIA